MMRSITRSIVICLPLGIAFFIGLLALAVGDDLEWWTIIGLGSLLGVLGAVLFGMLGGVTARGARVRRRRPRRRVDHDAH